MDQIRLPHFMAPRLEELGVPMGRVLEAAGLPPGLFEQDRIIVSTAESFALWTAITAFNQDPTLGLKMGANRHDRLELANPAAIIALSSRSLHEAFMRLARYKRLFCSEDLRLVREDPATWSLEAVWHLAREQTPSLLVDSMFASFVDLARQGTGRAIVPAAVRLRRREQHRKLFEAFFMCPVHFESESDRLLFYDADLALPFRSHNPELLAALEPHLEAELQRKQEPPLAGQVKALLRSRLAGQVPTMQQVAADLHLSLRTLQRRLAEEGTGFHQLLSQARRELAHQYLLRPDFDLGEVAYLVGYEETSSFHRAFQSWEGMSPGQWRIARLTG